jgi:uncharacterized damage-inducible protein DinB
MSLTPASDQPSASGRSSTASAATLIRSLHDHRLWTRLRLLESASALSREEFTRRFPIGMGSLHDSFVHLYAAEFAWIAALSGIAAPKFHEGPDFDGLPGLLRAWSDLDERWAEYLDSLNDTELARPVTRTNRAGVTFTTPASEVLVHVCTHAFYHAAQIVNMLRQLGVSELPETNYITFARQRGEGT